MFDTTVEDVFRQELQRLHYHELRFARQLSEWKLRIDRDEVLEAAKDAQEYSTIALGRMDVLLAYLKLRKTGLGCPMLAALEDSYRVRLQLVRREELGDIVILSSWLQWKHLAVSGYVASIELATVLDRHDVVTPLRQGMEESLAHIQTVSGLLETSAKAIRRSGTLEAALKAPVRAPLRLVSRAPEPSPHGQALLRAVENLLGAA